MGPNKILTPSYDIGPYKELLVISLKHQYNLLVKRDCVGKHPQESCEHEVLDQTTDNLTPNLISRLLQNPGHRFVVIRILFDNIWSFDIHNIHTFFTLYSTKELNDFKIIALENKIEFISNQIINPLK